MKTKNILALVLCLCVFCGCSQAPEDSSAPDTTAPSLPPIPSATQSTSTSPLPSQSSSTEATTSSTGATTPLLYTNPLTGESLSEPFINRLFAVSINNTKDALPHRGVYKADIYMEMFVNHSILRGLAIFSDIASVDSIGSVRSTRPAFTQLAQHFDCFIAHAGGSNEVLTGQSQAGIDHLNIDTANSTSYSYRDTQRPGSFEHTLFAKGPGLKEIAASRGVAVTREPGKTYGMTFVNDGTPKNGSTANSVTIGFTFGRSYKETQMIYHTELGKYVYNQYGSAMQDADTGTFEAFKNVLVLFVKAEMNGSGYHIYDFLTGGTGYFACGGRWIPIHWSCNSQNQPFVYFTEDGKPLSLGVGNSYIAIAPTGSSVIFS